MSARISLSRAALFFVCALFFAARASAQNADGEAEAGARILDAQAQADEAQDIGTQAINGRIEISKIEIVGLKRTKESFVQNVLKDFVGADAFEVDLNDVETKLQEQGLFSEIAAQIVLSSDSATLLVTVKEKLSFLVVPFVMGSNDGVMGGLGAMDMNAFGMKNMALATGVFSKTMQMGMLLWSKPALDARHPGFMANAMVNHRSKEYATFDDDTICEYDMLPVSGSISLRGIITRFLDYSVGALYKYIHYFDDDGDNLGDMHLGFLSASLSASKKEWTGFFMNTSSAAVSAEIGCDFASPVKAMGEVSLRANWQFKIIPRMKIDLSFAGCMAMNKPIAARPDKGSAGSSVLYSGFVTDKIASLKILYEAALFKAKFLTLSLYASYEAVIAADFDDSFVWSMGPGAGAKVYLNRIALPALAGGVAYDIKHNHFNFVISLGMGM